MFLVAPTFTAKAVILPPQQDQSSGNAILGQFGALASMSGLGSSLGIKNPVDLYIGILQSQTVTDAMIKRFDLVRFYTRKNTAICALLCKRAPSFVAGKDGMITISVSDHDPAQGCGYGQRLCR